MPLNVTTPATATNEYHDVYFDFDVRPYTFTPWFSSQYLTQGTAQNFTLNTPLASSGVATLMLNLWSLSTADHALQITINGQPAGQTQWNGGNKMMQLSFNVPAGILKNGSNTVTLSTPTIPGQESQLSFLHSICANYTRLLDGSAPLELVNDSVTSRLFELYNLPSAGAWVVDARFTDRAALVPTETQAVADGTSRLRFIAPSGGSGKFLVVPAGQENRPLSVTARLVRALRLTGTYLATGPAQFSAGVQPLLMARSKEGIRGTFVDQEQLFDYYNFGRFGPDGIRSAVRATRPQNLLLAGRTTYDYRNYSGANVDPLCPAFLVSTSFWSQATSDSLFGDLGRGYPEVAVGRLPVNNAAELSGIVSRITGYKGAPTSGIRLHAVADRTDPDVADFGRQLTTLAQTNPDLAWQTNTLGLTSNTSAEVYAAMTAAANGGADWLLFHGHGNASRLGKDFPKILDTDSVQSWTGSAIFLQSTCTANWMAGNVAGFKSIAMQALTQPQGGISASIASSTYMNSEAGISFMSELIKNARSGNSTRWGQALMNTQRWAAQRGSGFYADLNTTEQLFGDPAMPIFSAPPRGTGNKTGTTTAQPGSF